MKEKGIKYNSIIYGWIENKNLDLMNINPAKDHNGYRMNVASVITDNLPKFSVQLYEDRYSTDSKGKLVNKIDRYVGGDLVSENPSILSLKFDKEFRSSKYHHADTIVSSSILQGM